MKYIKARYLKNDKPCGRAYAFATEVDVNPGDIAILDGGKRVLVTDEEVDTKWINTYGADKITKVQSIEEKEIEGE